MCPIRLVFLLTTLFSTLLLAQTTPLDNPLVSKTAVVGLSEPDPAMQGRIAENYGKLPLSFEANHGQADGRVKFLSRTGGYTLFLTRDEAVLAMPGKNAKKSSPQGLKPASLAGSSGTLRLRAERAREAMPFPKTVLGTSSSGDDVAAEDATGSVLRMKLRNANPAVRVTGVDKLAATSNYFIGNDPVKWRSDVPTYAKVKYEGIYSGIDLIYYGSQRQVEYDFIVAPGADPRRIAFDVRGAKRVRRDEYGDLILKVGENEIRWHKPVVYQEKNGARQEVAARYAIKDANQVGFEVGKYDEGRTLYIDPLIYSTYLGGDDYDNGTSIAVDSSGNAYVTGLTSSINFPTTSGGFQTICNGPNSSSSCGDAFVAKINPSGSALVYSTYLGGAKSDQGRGIAVDSAGNAYITGTTSSNDFPTTSGGFQTICIGPNPSTRCQDAFVAKINPSGSALVYSTYLGGSSGSDYGVGIAVDSAGRAYVTGITASIDFPTKNPLQAANAVGANGYDTFVAKLNAAGSALVYSTYLGGSGDDAILGFLGGIAVDSAGNAYVTGSTISTDFPTKNPLQAANAGIWDVFIAKINATGSALIYSTYIGGSSDDFGEGIAVDSAGSAYITGTRYYDGCTGNCVLRSDAFVYKLNSSGSALVYATNVGTGGHNGGRGIAVDSSDNAYIIGVSYHLKSITRVFAAKVSPAGSAVGSLPSFGGNEGAFGGGIAADVSGHAYVTGDTQSTNFPTLRPLQKANAGFFDAFVVKIDTGIVTATSLSCLQNPSRYGEEVTFTAVVTPTAGSLPNGETVTFMEGTRVLGTEVLSNGSASFTTSMLFIGTNSITAVYAGDSNFAGSKSRALSQVVSKATTTTTLTSSQNPSSFGQSVTFTASVAPQFSGTVHGTVTFYDGTTALRTNSLNGGLAKFTTSALASGKHNITATYNGGTSFSGSSASLMQTVN